MIDSIYEKKKAVKFNVIVKISNDSYSKLVNNLVNNDNKDEAELYEEVDKLKKCGHIKDIILDIQIPNANNITSEYSKQQHIDTTDITDIVILTDTYIDDITEAYKINKNIVVQVLYNLNNPFVSDACGNPLIRMIKFLQQLRFDTSTSIQIFNTCDTNLKIDIKYNTVLDINEKEKVITTITSKGMKYIKQNEVLDKLINSNRHQTLNAVKNNNAIALAKSLLEKNKFNLIITNEIQPPDNVKNIIIVLTEQNKELVKRLLLDPEPNLLRNRSNMHKTKKKTKKQREQQQRTRKSNKFSRFSRLKNRLGKIMTKIRNRLKRTKSKKRINNNFYNGS